MSKRATQIVQLVGDPLEILQRCGGFYECPKSSDKKRRLGPLVGYAGKYLDGKGEPRQWVGDVYYNFAKAEEYPHVLDHFAYLLVSQIIHKAKLKRAFDYVLGAPMGGIAFAFALARELDCRYVYAEKKVTALATTNGREQASLELVRHEIEPGAEVCLVEDICNNFSTTGKLVELVQEHEANVTAIACELNRSGQSQWEGIPIYTLVNRPTLQYKQDDPKVAEDIAKGKVVWKPKDHWEELMEAMREGGLAD